jgi:hypothetical protein
MFGFEMFMAFGSTEFEYFAIISDEGHSVSWIDRSGTEVTFLYSHVSTMIILEFIIFIMFY